MHNIILVNTPDTLNSVTSLIDSLNESYCISLDTEFNRVTTFYPRLDIIQLCIQDKAYLIDVYAVDIKSLIVSLSSFKGKLLVFSGSEDLSILHREGQKLGLDKALCDNIIDVQLLMSFLNLGYSVGLQGTLLKYLDIDLPKDQTLSDWSERPLSDRQIEYAANDVFFLESLYKKLLSSVKSDDVRLSWFALEMKRFVKVLTKDTDKALLYTEVPGAGSLNKKELAILKVLCIRRYEKAIADNDALNRIITSKALTSICRLNFINAKTLAASGMKWGAIRENCENVRKWFAEGKSLKLPDDFILPYDYFSSTSQVVSDYQKKLKHELTEIAKKAEIAPELISSKYLILDLFHAAFYKREAVLKSSWYLDLTKDIILPEEVNAAINKK